MGNEPSQLTVKKGSSRFSIKAQTNQYNSNELTLLERMFEDLAKRSPNKTMSKDTFLEYFALPGILGERLFEVFDTKKDGVIHYEEFVQGLTRYNKGTVEDKIAMLFEMYDMNGKKEVDPQELSIILYSLITPTTSLFYSRNNKGLAQDEDNNIIHTSVITREAVDKLVKNAFDECDLDKNNKLSFTQFSLWVKKNPEALDVLETTLAKHMWSGWNESDDDENKNEVDDKQSNQDYDDQEEEKLQSKTLKTGYATPRKSLPSHFEDLYSALTEQYEKDSKSDEVIIAKCKNCLIQYHTSLNVSKNSSIDTQYTEYVFWKKNGASSAKLKYCPQCGKELDISVAGPIRTQPLGLTFANSVGSESSFFEEKKRNSGTNIQIDLKSTASIQKELHTKKFQKKISGDLWKLGRYTNAWVSRYYVVKDKFLYTFKTKKSESPSSVQYISGWFISKKDDEYKSKGYYGIELHPPHGDSTYQMDGKMIYARSDEDRNVWVSQLQVAASTVAIQTHYEIGKVLGKGHFSVVHLGTHRQTNKKYAIKVIEKSRIDSREKLALRNEIAIMKLVDHPCIIRMNDVYEDKKCIYMVMTLVPYGDFFERWKQKKRFPEKIAKIIIWKLLDAVHYLHSLGIVHRDLKPENILCLSKNDDTQIVISDFGLSKFAAPHTEMTMPCGTLAYVAPEVLLLKKQEKGYGAKVDLWSIGCIMYLLLRGVLPFDSKKKNEIIEKTLNKKLEFDKTSEKWKNISDDAIDILSNLLIKKPENRIDLEDALKHKWFQDIQDNEKLQLTVPDKDIEALILPVDSPLASPKVSLINPMKNVLPFSEDAPNFVISRAKNEK